MGNTPLLIVPDILLAENVFLSIGRKEIITGATINTERGHITGLLGRNGAGKSTLLQSLFGTRHPQDCDIFLNGVRIKKPCAINGLVNYLPQQPFLPPGLTFSKIAAQFGVRLNDILDEFPDLEQDTARKVGSLSGGTGRLLTLLLLLFADTRFTMLDEPFTHLMPLHIERLKQLLHRLKENKGIIITDHLYRHVLDISDKLFLMKDGRSIYIKNWDDLVLHGYANELSAEYR